MIIEPVTLKHAPWLEACKDCPGAVVASDGTITVDADCYREVVNSRIKKATLKAGIKKPCNCGKK